MLDQLDSNIFEYEAYGVPLLSGSAGEDPCLVLHEYHTVGFAFGVSLASLFQGISNISRTLSWTMLWLVGHHRVALAAIII